MRGCIKFLLSMVLVGLPGVSHASLTFVDATLSAKNKDVYQFTSKSQIPKAKKVFVIKKNGKTVAGMRVIKSSGESFQAKLIKGKASDVGEVGETIKIMGKQDIFVPANSQVAATTTKGLRSFDMDVVTNQGSKTVFKTQTTLKEGQLVLVKARGKTIGALRVESLDGNTVLAEIVKGDPPEPGNYEGVTRGAPQVAQSQPEPAPELAPPPPPEPKPRAQAKPKTQPKQKLETHALRVLKVNDNRLVLDGGDALEKGQVFILKKGATKVGGYRVVLKKGSRLVAEEFRSFADVTLAKGQEVEALTKEAPGAKITQKATVSKELYEVKVRFIKKDPTTGVNFFKPPLGVELEEKQVFLLKDQGQPLVAMRLMRYETTTGEFMAVPVQVYKKKELKINGVYQILAKRVIREAPKAEEKQDVLIFPVKVVKYNPKKNIYLLDDLQEVLPPKGALLMLKRSERKVLAAKVVLTSKKRKQLIVLPLKYFGKTTLLKLRSTYMATVLNSAFKEGKLAKRNFGKKRSFFFASAGYSTVDYFEEGFGDVAMTGLTGKFFYRFLMFPPDWDIGFNTYFTALPLSISGATTTEGRFLGVNGRIGWRVPGIKNPWRLTLLGGLFFTTMLVSQGEYGFSGLIGPQLFPAISYAINHRHAVMAYAKYSPLMSRLEILPFDSREIAAGVGYIYTLGNGHPISFNLDWNSMNLIVPTVIGDLTVSSTSLSLSAGYGF